MSIGVVIDVSRSSPTMRENGDGGCERRGRGVVDERCEVMEEGEAKREHLILWPVLLGGRLDAGIARLGAVRLPLGNVHHSKSLRARRPAAQRVSSGPRHERQGTAPSYRSGKAIPGDGGAQAASQCAIRRTRPWENLQS